MASWVSPRVSLMILPISRVMSREYSSLRSASISAARKTGSARCRDQPPAFKGALGRVHGSLYIGFAGLLKNGNHLAGVGRVAIFEGLPSRRFHPLAVNEVLIDLGRAARHGGGIGHGISRHKASSSITPNIPCYRREPTSA